MPAVAAGVAQANFVRRTDPLTMTLSRRHFVQAAATTVAALALPLVPTALTPTAAAAPCGPDTGVGPADPCETPPRAPGDPSFEPFWVATYLPTKLWPTASELDDPVDKVDKGRLFRVD